MNEQSYKYSDLVAKIKKKRNCITIFTLIIVGLILLLTSPTRLEISGEVIIDAPGLPSGLTALLVSLCILGQLIAISVAYLPIYTAMDVECDPEKQLILNMQLNPAQMALPLCATDYLYLGMYDEALGYAEKMVACGKTSWVLSGWFNAARCAFLRGDHQGLSHAAEKYTSTLANTKRMRPKALAAYQTMADILALMLAISANDTDTIQQLRHTASAWNSSKATAGYVHFMQGIAAYKVDDKQDTIYHLKFVKENCPKTVFARLSGNYLDSIQE